MTENDAFEQARRLIREAATDEGMAQLAAMLFTGRQRADSEMAQLLAQVESRIQSDPDLAARYDRALQRLSSLEAAGDARAQFERLTGSRPGAARRHADRGPLQRGLSRNVRGSVVTGIAGLVVVVAVLFSGRFAEDPLSRMAFQELSSQTPGAVYRGTDSPEMLAALNRARQARSVWFGTWVRYDSRELAAAESLALLVQPSAEARLLLARIRLMSGNQTGAVDALEPLSREDSALVNFRARILDHSP